MRHVVLWWRTSDGVFVTLPDADFDPAAEGAEFLGPGALDDAGIGLMVLLHDLQDQGPERAEEVAGPALEG